jgi:hypothetical protein
VPSTWSVTAGRNADRVYVPAGSGAGAAASSWTPNTRDSLGERLAVDEERPDAEGMDSPPDGLSVVGGELGVADLHATSARITAAARPARGEMGGRGCGMRPPSTGVERAAHPRLERDTW